MTILPFEMSLRGVVAIATESSKNEAVGELSAAFLDFKLLAADFVVALPFYDFA